MSKTINYVKGDATLPQLNGNKIIAHICNDIGGWGKGFVTALSKRWPSPEKKYRDWYSSQDNFRLGETQFVQVTDDIWVANMIGQHKITKDEKGNPPIRYDAVANALKKVSKFAVEINASVHMPRIGCGLAGGTWDKIEPLIISSMIEASITVVVYDY
jgi:O-acetyl-ADP-ribose deacetylase (regulator of RNase III)